MNLDKGAEVDESEEEGSKSLSNQVQEIMKPMMSPYTSVP